MKEKQYECGTSIDRLLHPFFGARSSTYLTPRFYRRSRPRTIRPARRLPRRDLCRNKTYHHSSPLRRHLRASRDHAASFPSSRISNKASNRSSHRCSAHRPYSARGPRLARRSHPRHRLKRRKHRIRPDLRVPSKPHLFELETLKPGSTFPTRHPYHFRATRCCVSPLTGTIYGSTLSIPEHFLQTSLKEARP